MEYPETDSRKFVIVEDCGILRVPSALTFYPEINFRMFGRTEKVAFAWPLLD